MIDLAPKRYVHIEPAQRSDPGVLEAVLKNPKVPYDQKKKLFPEYLERQLARALHRDRELFSPSQRVYKGTPARIPDGYHYMGPDPEPNPAKRRGEIIVVDKRKVLEKSTHFFWQVFDAGRVSVRRAVEIVADEIDWTMYAEGQGELTSGSGIVNLHDRIEVGNPQCRHKALYFQVLAQTLGIESRYVPADVIFEDTGESAGHGMNLVRIDDEWHLLSVTRAPRLRLLDGATSEKLLICPIPEQSVDINKQVYTWRPDFWYKTLVQIRQNAYFQVK